MLHSGYAQFSIEVAYAPPTGPAEFLAQIRPNTKMLWGIDLAASAAKALRQAQDSARIFMQPGDDA